MKDKIFLDSDVILDYLTDRKPYSINLETLFALFEFKKIEAFTSALVLANVYYFCRKFSGTEKAKSAVKKLMFLLEILPVSKKEIQGSLESGFADFEDGIQSQTAQNHQIKILLTRNLKDYKKSGLTILSPDEYLKSLTE